MTTTKTEAAVLLRELGTIDAAMIVVGSMIGSGIFITSAESARFVGAPGWLLLAWGLAGVMTITGSLCAAEIAAMMPRAGGQYVFLREAYSPLFGFLFGWSMFLVVQTGTIAAVAVAFAKFLGVFTPQVAADNYIIGPLQFAGGYALSLSSQQLVAVALIAFLTLVNTQGLRLGKWIQNTFTFTKAAALIGLIAVGLFLGTNFDSAAWTSSWWNSTVNGWNPRGLVVDRPLEGPTALLLLLGLAMIGPLFSQSAWNNVTFTGGEVRDPGRTLPRALILGVSSVVVLYLLANVAYIVTLPFSEIQYAPQDRVGTAVMEAVLGPSGGKIMAAAILISTFGCVNGLVMAGARVFYAMAKDRLFFQAIATTNRHHVPAAALFTQGLWACLLVLPVTMSAGPDGIVKPGNVYGELLEYVIPVDVLFYTLMVAAVVALRWKVPDMPRPYRTIGYPLPVVTYIALAVLLVIDFIYLKPKTSGKGFLIVLAGIPVFLIWSRLAARENAEVDVASPLRQWRSWVLVALLVGPVLVYVGLGMLWLWERGWVVCTIAAVVWVVAGVVFSVLASRWTKTSRSLMPPLDWDSPHTFSPLDRDAWKLVQEEADQGETLTFDTLLGADVYIDTGRRLMKRLIEHYHPLTAQPFDDVPVVELLTAFELAAEDLSGLCRQVPGGDMISLSHYRRAVQVAGYITRANDLYAYVSPFLNPITGLTRLGTREWIVKPAWKSMQQNILRWFFEAYVNRLGMHLIELLSGRLAIGAHQYRRLTRRPAAEGTSPLDQEPKPLAIAVAGAHGSGKSRLIAAIKQACLGEMNLIKARAEPLGLSPGVLDRFKEARWIESAGYPRADVAETRRDRYQRERSVTAAADCDLLLLVVDGCQRDHGSDLSFAQAWDRWFREHPQREVPPTLVLITGVDRPEFSAGGNVGPAVTTTDQALREAVVRTQIESLRAVLPPTFHDFAAVGLGESPFGVIEHVVPALAPLLLQAERTALLRRLHQLANQSKAGRLVRQLGEHGRSLWDGLRARHKSETSREEKGTERIL